MYTGATSTGFEYTIDERVMNDYDTLAALRRAQSDELDDAEKMFAGMDLAEIVLGEQMTALKNHVKSKNDGFANVGKVLEESSEIIKDLSNAIKNVKN